MSDNFKDRTKQLTEAFNVTSDSTKGREFVQNGYNNYTRFHFKEHKENYSFHSLLEENIKEEPIDGAKLDELSESDEYGNIKLEPTENSDNGNPKSSDGSNFSNEESNMSLENNLTAQMPQKESDYFFENPGLLLKNMLERSMIDKRNIPQPIDLSVNNNNSSRYFEGHTNFQTVVHNTPSLIPLPLGVPLLLRTLQNNLQQKHLNSHVMSPNNSYSSFRELLQCSANIANLYARSKKIITQESCSNVLDMTYPQFKNEPGEDPEELFCMDGITDATKIEREELKTVLRINDGHDEASLPTDFDRTDSDDSKLFKCTTCSKQFLTKSRLTKHLLTHSEQSYSCSRCDFTTKRKDYLRVHELNHLETKMYKCSKCNFGTNVRSRLKIHENIHSEEKSFKCSSCPYMTSRKDNLKLHELNHLETKRFKCDQCGYASNNKRNLKEHLMNHWDLKLFKCPDCPYETNKKGNLKLHQVKHIPKVPKVIIPSTLATPLPNSNILSDFVSNSDKSEDSRTLSPNNNPFISSSVVTGSIIPLDSVSNTETSKESSINLSTSENVASNPIKSEEAISEDFASSTITFEEPVSDPEEILLNPYSFKNLVNDTTIPQDCVSRPTFKEVTSNPVSN